MQMEGEFLYVLAVFNIPVFLLLWYTLANLSWSVSDEKFIKLRIGSWIPFLASLTGGFVVFFLFDFDTALVVAFPAIFILFCKIFIFSRHYFTSDRLAWNKEGIAAEARFFMSEITFVNYLITFSIPVVTSVFITVAVLNENMFIRVVSGTYGALLILFLLIRAYSAEIFGLAFGNKSINVFFFTR